MKKLLALLCVAGSVQAAPWDLNIGQYDQFGTSVINRLTPLPAGPSDGLLVYDSVANLPKLASFGSGCALAGGVVTCSGTAQVNSDWNSVSGVSQILNKPTNISAFTNDVGYLTGITGGQVTAALGFTPGTGTVTSITAGTGLSGGVITTSGTISMPNTGTAGTYSAVTTDTQGRVTAGTNRSQSAQTRTLNSGFQISSTRDALAFYSVQMTVTASIGGGQDGDVFLDIASDSGFTTNLQTLSVGPCSQTYTLAIALQGVQKCSLTVSGYVPAAYYTRLRTVNNTGTPAYQYRAGQEVLL
jgi:hypothetical protein